MLKMLKTSSLELFEAKLLYLRYASRYSNTIFSSTVVKVRLLWPVSHIITVVCSKFYYFKNFNSCKMLKMLNISSFELFKENYCNSGMPQGILMRLFAQQWWMSGYCDQFHTYSRCFAANFIFSKISIAGKCSNCLKKAVLTKITVSQVCLKVFQCNFLLNSGESQVTVTSFTHIHGGLQ